MVELKRKEMADGSSPGEGPCPRAHAIFPLKKN